MTKGLKDGMYKAVDTYYEDKDSKVCILMGNYIILFILHSYKDHFSEIFEIAFLGAIFVNVIISIVDICTIFLYHWVNIQFSQYTIFNVHLGWKWDSSCDLVIVKIFVEWVMKEERYNFELEHIITHVSL